MSRLPRIPDLLTTANLACGVASILLASQGQLTIACWLVFVAALFDVLDGLAARALGGGSEFGKQLDSLADMVSFGVAPGVLVYHFVGQPVSAWLIINIMTKWDPADFESGRGWASFISILIALVIPVAAAWRLARFNLDTRQAQGFRGLPTPANALFWTGTYLGISGIAWLSNPLTAPGFNVFALVVLLVLSGLMLSSLSLPSLKFQHFRWKGNEVIYLLLGTGAVLVVMYGVLAVPLILLLYLLSPLWGRFFPNQNSASSH